VKVLLVNKFFFPAAGAETVALQTADLLRDAGHEVVPFAMDHPNSLATPWSKHFAKRREYNVGSVANRAADGLASIYSLEARRKLRRLLEEVSPDVAHLHNVYHQLSLSILDELKRARVPVVMTLHDYKAVCPNYQLLAPDGLCTRCLGGAYWNAVAHRCIKGSYTGSAIAALEAYLNRFRRQYDKVDLFVSPSQFLADMLYRAGFASERVTVIPNAVAQELATKTTRERPRFVFAGRLSEEKGLNVLLKAASLLRSDASIVICGDGPLREHVERVVTLEGLPVELKGFVPPSEARALIGTARALVLPSIWYENCPMSILEAAAKGTPTIGSRLGGVPELVVDRSTGLLVDRGDPVKLAEAIDELAEDAPFAQRLGEGALDLITQRHAPSDFLQRTLAAYVRVGAEGGIDRAPVGLLA
jgi:glycosyltransferase involved in cell wall biosynthesis